MKGPTSSPFIDRLYTGKDVWDMDYKTTKIADRDTICKRQPTIRGSARIAMGAYRTEEEQAKRAAKIRLP